MKEQTIKIISWLVTFAAVFAISAIESACIVPVVLLVVCGIWFMYIQYKEMEI